MRLFATFLLAMLLAVPAWAAQVFEGKVVGISDGDTITVLRSLESASVSRWPIRTAMAGR